jgi:hypothetical protein
MVIDADLAGVAIEVAVTVTVDPVGITDGAVYVMPLASSLGLKAPHAPGLPQVTDQVTRLLIEPKGPEVANVAAAARVTEA